MKKDCLMKMIKKEGALYVMIIPAVVLIFLFNYIPMYGVLMAFQNHIPAKGITGSEWVGLKHFVSFFRDPFCGRIFKNTILLGAYSLLWGFPAPILLALLLNELRESKFKRIVQTVSYMPFFISTVIIIGLMNEIFSLSGILNQLISSLGGTVVSFMERPEWFRTLYIGSGIWSSVGYSSIIYLAAISGVNPELYESAILDGANRLQQARYITIPSIMPTVSIMFIMNAGSILSNDLQKILLMYSPATYETADVINTYVYRKGLLGGQYSYSAAVGLFMSLISFILLWITNTISRKMGSESLI